MTRSMSRAVETTRVVDARVSRRCRRRRRLFGVAARASNDENDAAAAADAFTCMDVGNSREHAFLARELERACAVVRTRCFYEIEDERRAEPVTFSFDDDDDDDDDDVSIATRASKPRLRWWEDRVASETVRETMFQRVGMRGVRTFAAATRADADGTPLDAAVVASIRARASTSASSTTSREHPTDAAALRRWSVVRARDADDADSSLFVVAGTLDVHLGPSLPGEALVGARPSTDDDESFDPIDVVTPRRAYVFNVCVAPEFRGLGVAERLLARAYAHLRDDTDVVAAYAHVEIDNHAARRAYEKASYVVEFEQHRSSDDGGEGAAPRALLYRRVERDGGGALKKMTDS